MSAWVAATGTASKLSAIAGLHYHFLKTLVQLNIFASDVLTRTPRFEPYVSVSTAIATKAWLAGCFIGCEGHRTNASPNSMNDGVPSLLRGYATGSDP